MMEALTPFQHSPLRGDEEGSMLAKRTAPGALSFTMARRAAAAGADDIIVAPEEGVTKYYSRSGTGLAYSNGLYSEPQAGTIEIVETADGTVYIKDIISHFIRGTWLKGSVSGSTVTFSCPQYLGLNGTIDAWAVGVDNNGLRDGFTFTYDAEAKTLSLDAGQQIVASATTDIVYALAYISQLTIYAPSELYTTPVTLDLTREGALRDFTVIDNNGDGRTWTWDERFGIYYMYHRYNTADDYLILPIHLEEAQNYHFVMTASTANDELVEKFEVLAGKSQAIDDLNITVIPEQAFASANEVEFDGSFLSEEAGTYYIAIHAVSDPDKWRLHVSKITVEPGADTSTPAAVTDLTAVPFEGALGAVLNFTAPTKSIVGDELAADGISRVDILRDDKVIGSADGEPVATLATEEINAEYKTVKVSLAGIESTRFATVGIEADFVNSSYISPYYSMFGDSLAVDNIRIIDLMEHDLQASIRARSAVRAGGVAAVTATVENKGDLPANGYTVVIMAGDKELFNKTVNESLAPFQKAEYTAELHTSVFDADGEVNLSVNVVYDGDQNLDNNMASTAISVLAPMAAQPQNLTGAQDGNDIALAWDVPETNFTTTEDVEEYADADNGGLNEINHLGNIGEWTVFDGNEGKAGYGFNGISSSIGNPGSWIVFNPANYATANGSLADNYPAHSGDQYFVSSCVSEPQGAIEATDHWLISPELPGVAQTIELYVCEFDNQYGAEKFEVLASSTDKEVSSFSLVTTRGANSKNWQRMTIDLPEGTKYFAIRHVSQDVFALLLDDISYLVATGDVAGYNVYADKQLIAAVSGRVTSYTEEAQKYSLGDHVFAVSAVYADGLESKPVAVNVTVVDPAGISLVAADGKPVDVYSLDGKLVRRQATDFSGLRGVYVIKGKAVLVK